MVASFRQETRSGGSCYSTRLGHVGAIFLRDGQEILRLRILRQPVYIHRMVTPITITAGYRRCSGANEAQNGLYLLE